eukprot:1152579-Pelagomonas_calceolata.AAC.5
MADQAAGCRSMEHVLLKSVASLSSTFMQRWNTTEVTGRENIEAALKRPRDQVRDHGGRFEEIGEHRG